MVLIDVEVTLAQARRGRDLSVAGCIDLHRPLLWLLDVATRASKADNGFPGR